MAKDPRFDRTSDQLKNHITGNDIAYNTITTDNILWDWPVFAGSLANYTSNKTNYIPYLNSTFNIGFNLQQNSNNSRLIVQKAGYYYVHVQQLVNTTGGVYLHIRKDGNTIVYAYSDNDSTYDLVANALIQCSVGTIIDFYYSGTTTYSWPAPHSSVSCHFVRP